MPFLQKLEFFQNSSNIVCVSISTTCGASFSKIGPYLGELGAQKPQKWPISWMLLLPQNFLKIYNLRTTNAMKMKLGTIVYLHETFHLTKDLGVVQGGSRSVAEKLLKKYPKMGFLAPFFDFLKLYQKNRYICDTLNCITSLVNIL